MKFEVAIPTHQREADLKKCLDSIYRQDVLPERIMIIDDDELPAELIEAEKKRFGLKEVTIFHYQKDHRREPRGSNESRNKGIELAQAEIVFILDDDLILEDGFLREIMKVWEQANDPHLIGVGGVIVNNRKKGQSEKFYNKIFGLSSKYSWDINEVGFQVWDDGIEVREKGYYLHGGAAAYKRSLVKEVGGFVIAKGGRGGGVDPDFCLRAKNKGYFFIMEPRAKTVHKESKAGREKKFLTGFKDAHNKKILFQRHCRKNIKNYLWFYWASFGWILRQFLAGNFHKGVGMIKGLFS